RLTYAEAYSTTCNGALGLCVRTISTARLCKLFRRLRKYCGSVHLAPQTTSTSGWDRRTGGRLRCVFSRRVIKWLPPRREISIDQTVGENCRNGTVTAAEIAPFRVLLLAGMEVGQREQSGGPVRVLFYEPDLVTSQHRTAEAGAKQRSIVSGEHQLRRPRVRTRVLKEFDEPGREPGMQACIDFVHNEQRALVQRFEHAHEQPHPSFRTL